MLQRYAAVAVVAQEPLPRARCDAVERQHRLRRDDQAFGPHHAKERHGERCRACRATIHDQPPGEEAILPVELFHHLFEEAARQRELVERPALHAPVGRESAGVAGSGQAVEPARAEKAPRRRGDAREIEEAARNGIEGLAQGGCRHHRHEPRQGTGVAAELGGRLEQDQGTHALGMKRGKDRRQRPAERMSGKGDARLPGFPRHAIETGDQKPVGIIAKPQRVRLAPIDEIDAEARPEAAPNHAHRRGQIPDIGPLDRRRDDQEDGRGGASGIGAQPDPGQAQRNARRRRRRPQAERIEEFALTATHPVGLPQGVAQNGRNWQVPEAHPHLVPRLPPSALRRQESAAAIGRRLLGDLERPRAL